MHIEQDSLRYIVKQVAIVCLIAAQGWVHAAVIRDGTIGPDGSVQPVGPDFEIPEHFGALNGTNLFHSFQEFSLGQDQSATFTGTRPIDNIIGRVTGGNASNIDGLLRSTVPGANLYLMNPHGVIFGANAQLDVQGAFHVGTGEALMFTDGKAFSAVPGAAAPILSMALPEQFGFLGAAPIEFHGGTLASAHDVAFSAGVVALRDGARIVTATDSERAGASITVTAVEGVSLSGLDAHGMGSGLDAGTTGTGQAGAIRVEAPLIELGDGAWVSAATAGAGNGGDVRLVAGEHLTLSGRNGDGQSSSLQAQAGAEGNAGLIALEAPVIELRDGAFATTATTGAGNGGELLVTATQRLSLSGKTSEGLGAAFLASAADGGGSSGTVRAIAPQIELRDGAYVTTTTNGVGEGGDMLIVAGQRLILSGTDDEGFGSSLRASTLGAQAAGDILVTAPVIELQHGAWMESNSMGDGDGGELSISAGEQLTLSGTDGNGFGSSLQATATGAGTGGTLTIDARRVDLRDGAFALANTAGVGEGGALTVIADERLVLSGANAHGLGSRLEANAQELGDGGEIKIQAPVITLADGASIATTSVGTGRAGSITMDVGEALRLTGRSAISTSARTALGGDIDIQAGSLIHLSESEISTNVDSGPGGGGDVTANADVLVLSHSRITAQADAGKGGTIEIAARQIWATPDSVIDASAGPAGIDGTVVITEPETDLSDELARPAAAFLDASTLLRANCEARAQRTPGSLTVARQQGLPLSPENLLLAYDASAFIPAAPARLEVSALGASAALRGETLRGVALKQQAEGHYIASLDTLSSALLEQPEHIAATLGSGANAYLALGLGDTALAYFIQAIDAAAGDHRVLATLYNNLGNLHMVRQDVAAASAAYRESVHRARRVHDVLQEAKALSNGARAELAGGRYEHAAALQRQARDLVDRVVAGQDKAHILIHLAKTAQLLSLVMKGDQQQRLAAAYTDLRSAVVLSGDLGDDRTLSYALGNLGSLYKLRNRLVEALYLTRLALQAAERANAPESQYRWHWQIGRLLWAQGDDLDALEAYRRAVVILEDGRPESLAQYGAAHVYFRQTVAPVYLDLVDALLQRSSRLDDPVPLLEEARATVEQFKAAELRDYFRDECITELEAKNTRLENVSPSAAIIYPILLPQRLELLVSLPNGLRRYAVPVDSATLTQATHQFRALVETQGRERQLRNAAQRLYDWLVRPYAEALTVAGIDTLVFVPGGPLRAAPLAALHDGDDYLIRRYGVVVTPGLSLTDPRPLNRKNPRVLLAGISDPVQEFAALPHVTEELDRIRELFGGRVLLNEHFTLSSMENALDAPVTIVHLASHARFTGKADDSYLLTHSERLSMAQLGDVLEIPRFRDQPLEMLVLSACQTAVGDERAVMGLAGIGLKAGARSAVGSLWFISDEGTSELMGRFYTNLKDSALTKAQALQQAQQAMLDDGRFGHPYYWSPFLLMNNWL